MLSGVTAVILLIFVEDDEKRASALSQDHMYRKSKKISISLKHIQFKVISWLKGNKNTPLIKIPLREKCPNTEFFSGQYFPTFGLNTDQKKLRIWTHITQCTP